MKDYKNLPEYPVNDDLWCRLARETRPLVIYGMGNGADKLINKGGEYGIKFSDIFASDGFVRGHSFRGMRVKSFSEIKETYSDFLIILSFASSRPEVLSMLREMNEKYDMVVPDMPVAGEEYFTKDFYNANYESIKKAYDSFSDLESKELFASIINYKLNGRMNCILGNTVTAEEIYSLIPEGTRCYVDCGAYNGDTVREAIRLMPSIKKVYAYEPDRRNFAKLEKYASELEGGVEIKTRKAAVWKENTTGAFFGSGNRNSTVSATASYKNREEDTCLLRIDGDIAESVDLIKYDVEGAEAEALSGSSGLIEKYRPNLIVSLYHRSEDIFSLVNLIKGKYPSYKLYLRRTECLPAWEIQLIAVAEA